MSSRVTCPVIAAGILTAAGIYYFYNKKKQRTPKEWVEVGKVTSLFVYPLKSARRIEVQSGECTAYGLVATEQDVPLRDRSFLIYGGPNNEFKTARTHPKIVLIKLSVVDKNHLLLEAPDQQPIKLRIPDANSPKLQINQRGEKIDAIDCGQEVADWISKFLGEEKNGFRVGYHDGAFARAMANNKNKNYTKIEDRDMGMYSDLTGYLLMNKASVDKLNTELEEPVSANNFRPNILIEGENCPPFSEENWDFVKIGSAVFRSVKPCTRCIFTTVDPENGVKHPKREPLATLERYNVLKDPEHVRMDGKKPVMGIQMGIRTPGTIKIGDVVYASK